MHLVIFGIAGYIVTIVFCRIFILFRFRRVEMRLLIVELLFIGEVLFTIWLEVNLMVCFVVLHITAYLEV